MNNAEPTPDVLLLFLGNPYRYSRGGLYAPLFVATCAQSDTPKVVYVGLDGKDEGKHYLCSLTDWDLRFTLAEEAPEAPALPVLHRATIVTQSPPRRVAGAFSSGSGV